MREIKITSLKVTGPAVRAAGSKFLEQPVEYGLENGESYATTMVAKSQAELTERLDMFRSSIARRGLSVTVDQNGHVNGFAVGIDVAALQSVASEAASSNCLSISDTIQAQIVAVDPFAFMAWGAKHLETLPPGNSHLGGLRMKVNGAKSGPAKVAIVLGRGDTYTVTVSRNGRKGHAVPLAHVENVDCFELMKTIDQIIERDS